MKHEQKVKIARRIMTRLDRKNHIGPFNTVSWQKRKDAIAKRVARKQALAHSRALERKAENAKLKASTLTK